MTYPASPNATSSTLYRGVAFSDLLGSTSYVVQVTAVNSVGPSSTVESPVVTTLPPVLPTAPGKPSFVSATGGSVVLTFNRPVNYGGSPLLQYIVEASLNLTAFSVYASSVLAGPDSAGVVQARVVGLAATTVYFFRVSAVTRLGRGPASTSSSPSSTVAASAAAAPRAPTTLANVTASSGVAVWAPTDDTGGYPVTGYLLRVSATGPPASLFHVFSVTVPVAALRCVPKC